MRKNVIILTYGLSGSSVLTGLLVRSGLWPGHETYRKPDYDTFENTRLIELNKRLFAAAGFSGNYENEFNPDALAAIARLDETKIDVTPFRQFVEECNAHAPWIWKDPRLWLTIRFWARVLDLDEVQFILLTRSPLQSWISYNLRRQIQSYAYAKRYCEQIESSIHAFFAEQDLPHLDLLFDDLVLHPDRTLERINAYLGSSLTEADLRAVYHQPLRRRPRSAFDLVKASLIFMRNFGERQR